MPVNHKEEAQYSVLGKISALHMRIISFKAI